MRAYSVHKVLQDRVLYTRSQGEELEIKEEDVVLIFFMRCAVRSNHPHTSCDERSIREYKSENAKKPWSCNDTSDRLLSAITSIYAEPDNRTMYCPDIGTEDDCLSVW